jgi:hypothetical protein
MQFIHPILERGFQSEWCTGIPNVGKQNDFVIEEGVRQAVLLRLRKRNMAQDEDRNYKAIFNVECLQDQG